MKRAGSLTIHVVAEAAPPFAVFEGWGPPDLKGFIRHIAPGIYRLACSHAEAPSSLLRIKILALRHFQLLSTAALAKYTAPAHLVSGNSGAGAATVHLRGGRLRGHAGAFPSADQRAGAGKSFYRDAG